MQYYDYPIRYSDYPIRRVFLFARWLNPIITDSTRKLSSLLFRRFYLDLFKSIEDAVKAMRVWRITLTRTFTVGCGLCKVARALLEAHWITVSRTLFRAPGAQETTPMTSGNNGPRPVGRLM